MIKSAAVLRLFTLASFLSLCALAPLAKADEKLPPANKVFSIGGVYGATASIKSIDAERNMLELDWDSSELHATKIFLSPATRYKIREQEIAIAAVKVGDVLLDIRNRNLKSGESYFSASSLTVKSLEPLTLTVRGGRFWFAPPRERTPGETPSDAMIKDLQSNEIRGIGTFPRSDTLVVPAPEKMTFTRSIATAPLKISELSVGQNIAFDATVRPDGELNGLTLWIIKEKSPQR